MTVADIGIIAAVMSIIMALFTSFIWHTVNKVDSDLKACISRLDTHIVAINARTDTLQAAMMELLAERRK